MERESAAASCPEADPSILDGRPPLEPYRRPMPRVLGRSYGGGRFLMGEAGPS